MTARRARDAPPGERQAAGAGRLFPAGTPYRADDPELLLWVLFTLVDSALVVYRKYVGTLSRDEEAAYWDDYKHGRPAVRAARRRHARHARRPRRLQCARCSTGDDLHVTPTGPARAAARSCSSRRCRWSARPLLETVNFITIALLPAGSAAVRLLAAAAGVRARKALVAGGAEYVKRGVVPFLPERLRLVPHARAA